MKTRLINVVGARPSVITIAAIVEEMMKYPELEALLVHTGQHHDEAMCKSFVVDVNLPKRGIYLGVGSGGHGTQTDRVMI